MNHQVIIIDYKGREYTVNPSYFVITHKCSCVNIQAEHMNYFIDRCNNKAGWICKFCNGLIKEDNSG